jgi:hypothetical protein
MVGPSPGPSEGLLDARVDVGHATGSALSKPDVRTLRRPPRPVAGQQVRGLQANQMRGSGWPGADVMITIFGDFFSKNNVMIKILHTLALFWAKNAIFFANFFVNFLNHNIGPTLGVFSPFGRLFTLGNFVLKTVNECSPSFGAAYLILICWIWKIWTSYVIMLMFSGGKYLSKLLSLVPGVNVLIFNFFNRNIWRKFWHFLLKLLLFRQKIFHDIDLKTLFWNKNADNWEKILKIINDPLVALPNSNTTYYHFVLYDFLTKTFFKRQNLWHVIGAVTFLTAINGWNARKERHPNSLKITSM